MDYLLDLLQGLGIAAAIGIRPFLPTLFVGALAAGNLGLDFEGTDFAFLEQTGFLLAVVIAGRRLRDHRSPPRRRHQRPGTGDRAADRVRAGARRAGGERLDRRPQLDWWPGLIIGPAAAALGFMAARSLFGRVSARLDDDTAKALPLYAEGMALAAAGLSVLFPPLAILVVAALAWLLIGGRRRAGEKYAGLRILR